MKLNLGCGPVQPEGWVNVDYSYRARLATRLPWVDRALVRARIIAETEFRPGLVAVDLGGRLPWAEGSAEAIYGGEVLEHFTEPDGAAVLRECFRLLRPGGVLRIRVPDNARYWGSYLRDYEAARARPRAEWTDDHARWTRVLQRGLRPAAARVLRAFSQVGLRRGVALPGLRAGGVPRGGAALAPPEPHRGRRRRRGARRPHRRGRQALTRGARGVGVASPRRR